MQKTQNNNTTLQTTLNVGSILRLQRETIPYNILPPPRALANTKSFHFFGLPRPFTSLNSLLGVELVSLYYKASMMICKVYNDDLMDDVSLFS